MSNCTKKYICSDFTTKILQSPQTAMMNVSSVCCATLAQGKVMPGKNYANLVQFTFEQAEADCQNGHKVVSLELLILFHQRKYFG